MPIIGSRFVTCYAGRLAHDWSGETLWGPIQAADPLFGGSSRLKAGLRARLPAPHVSLSGNQAECNDRPRIGLNGYDLTAFLDHNSAEVHRLHFASNAQV